MENFHLGTLSCFASPNCNGYGLENLELLLHQCWTKSDVFTVCRWSCTFFDEYHGDDLLCADSSVSSMEPYTRPRVISVVMTASSTSSTRTNVSSSVFIRYGARVYLVWKKHSFKCMRSRNS